MASKEELADWNRRIRRLANGYAPKYRPVVLSLGYHTDLAEGRTYVSMATIATESARYTASGKPLQARYVKRLLADLNDAGAVKTETRYRDDTGRQTSSYRTLNTAVTVDRHGFTRNHDFGAPFVQVTEKKDTPQDTPQDTRTVFELDFDCQGTVSNYADQDQYLDTAEVQKDQNQEEPDPWYTWYVWRAKSGNLACYNAMAQGLDMRMIPSRAIQFVLRPEDGKWVWDTLAAWDMAGCSVDAQATLLVQSFGTDQERAMLGIERAA